ncbi:MAG: hypothetical protein CMH41_05385 [Micrococcales bacterium]|nr:hypothetical protein [Micrococcales bacterium]
MTAMDALVRIQRVIAVLTLHPDGLPLTVLAEELDVSADQLQSEILAYYRVDVTSEQSAGMLRPEVIDFVSVGGEVVDPHQAPVIRLASDVPEAELGIRQLSAADVSALYMAARSLRQFEPENEVLQSATERLERDLLGEEIALNDDSGTDRLAVLREAIRTSSPAVVEYSREWLPGVGQRTIHPYRLLQTDRGFELDAGPLVDGRPRTYLLRRMRSAYVVDDVRFDKPDNLESILDRDREPVRVQLSLPQGSHWVADRFAERTEVVAADGDDLTLDVYFLPPVERRVALVLLVAGAESFVIEPPEYSVAASQLAEQLFQHHGFVSRS